MATINGVGNSLTSQTGTGLFVGSISPDLVTPGLGVATATSMAFSNNSTGGILGATDGSSAAAGYVGHIISSTIAAASGVSLTSGVVVNVTSISLPAGRWRISGNTTFNGGATTGIYAVYGWISLSSATIPDTSLLTAMAYQTPNVLFNFTPIGMEVPVVTITTASPITVYLSADANFVTSTCNAYGQISAERF